MSIPNALIEQVIADDEDKSLYSGLRDQIGYLYQLPRRYCLYPHECKELVESFYYFNERFKSKNVEVIQHFRAMSEYLLKRDEQPATYASECIDQMINKWERELNASH